MHILIWVLNTSPKLHLWENALNSLRFEPVLSPQCVVVKEMLGWSYKLLLRSGTSMDYVDNKTGSGLECGCFFQHPREFRVSVWISGSPRRTVLELGRRLGGKGPGRAQQPKGT